MKWRNAKGEAKGCFCRTEGWVLFSFHIVKMLKYGVIMSLKIIRATIRVKRINNLQTSKSDTGWNWATRWVSSSTTEHHHIDDRPLNPATFSRSASCAWLRRASKRRRGSWRRSTRQLTRVSTWPDSPAEAGTSALCVPPTPTRWSWSSRTCSPASITN